jgi:tetratricopeptide (TPR) repeat protein
MKKQMLVCVTLISSLVASAGAQEQNEPRQKASPANGQPKAAEVKPEDPNQVILRQIKSGNEEQIKQAIASIRSRLASPSSNTRDDASKRLADEWARLLMEAEQYDAVAQLALAGQLARTAELRRLEVLQAARVRALLAGGKAKEALAAARSLYNVSSMSYTKDAMILLADALRAANPDDSDLYEQLVAEQVEGARASTQPSSDFTKDTVGSKASVLASLRADEASYLGALDERATETYASLFGRGNVLLLAGRVEEAQPLFERAYTMAPDNKLGEATESLARVMKARDGTVGRANQFVLSLRPKKNAE